MVVYPSVNSWLSDLKVSIRLLAKTPGFSASAIGVLALGIGLNAAMFSVIYALAIMGRPFAEPDRLVQLYSSQVQEPDSYRAFSFPAYEQLASSGGVFEGVLAHNPTIVGIGEGADSRRTFAVVVSRLVSHLPLPDMFAGLPITRLTALVSFSTLVLVGVLAALYPAQRASRLTPSL